MLVFVSMIELPLYVAVVLGLAGSNMLYTARRTSSVLMFEKIPI